VDDTGSWDAPHRYTSDLLAAIGEYGRVPYLSAADRAQVRADLVFWRAAVVVLVPDSRNSAALRSTVTDALGQSPQLIGGAEVWDVRSLQVPPPE